jgi:adenylate cyclase
LEGSVRKVGDRVRITGQLIEANTGSHVWADRFDGELADIFGLQDRVAEAVVRAAAPSLRMAEIRRARKTPTESLDAYDLYLRALPHFYVMAREGNEEALRLAQRALDLDPDFARAAVLAALVLAYRSAQDWASPGADNAEIVHLARRAVAAEPGEPEVLAAAAQAMSYASVEAHEEAVDLVGRALALGPNFASVLGFCGWAYAYVGRPSEALELFERAIRFDPLDPMEYSTLTAMAFCHIQLGQDEAAIAAATRAVAQNPNFSTPLRLKAAAQALAGRMDEAAATARLVLERYEPGFTLTAYLRRIHLAEKAKARSIEGMRKAGFPE